MSLIFFIPGTACNEQTWSKLWPLLDQNNQLVHLKLAKSGSLVDVVAMLVANIKEISNGREFSLIGFSLGGYLASAISLHFNQQLTRLMVIANVPKTLPLKELAARKSIIASIEKSGYQGLKKNRLRHFLDSSQHDNEPLFAIIMAMDSCFTKEDVIHHLGPLSVREDLTLALVNKKLPIWFCFGDNDALVNEQQLLTMQLGCRHISLHEIASCGHFLPLEQPLQLAQLIKDWLQR
ncbi:alpha/beta hydrolase [Gammaproteobacteria bacterium AS21]|jgi:pimeloyl-ACP methyl ester carboxylesterase